MSQNKQIVNVTPQQLEILSRRIITSKEKLDQFLRVFLGVYLASTPIDEGNTSPLDFVWDIYSTAIGINPDPVYNFIGMAARGSMKSLSAAVVETLLLGHDTRSWFSMAAIKEQAMVVMGYVLNFLQKPFIKDFANKQPLKGLVHGRYGNILKIGSATMEQVNSFHGSILQDEVELTDEAVFNESRGMLTAEKGKLPIAVYISSRKFAFGNIQRLLDQHELERLREGRSSMRVHKWGILETTDKCHLKRSGKLRTQEIYVDEDSLIAISSSNYSFLSRKQKLSYRKFVGHENCLTCGIFSFCLGRLISQKGDNPYLQPIETTKDHFLHDDTIFFRSQRLNRKPSQIGLVYPMYDESIHIKTFSEMYEVCTEEPSDKPVSRDDFVKWILDNGGALFLGVDFGWHVAAAVLVATGPQDKVFVIKEGVYSKLTHKELGQVLKRDFGIYPIERVFPDYESQEGIKQLREIGLPVPIEGHNINKNVSDGVAIVRNLLRIPGSLETNLYFSSDCPNLKEEIRYYRHKVEKKTGDPSDEIEKGNDHCLDCLRYCLIQIFGRIKSKVSFAKKGLKNGDPNYIEFNPMNPARPPTGLELLAYVGKEIRPTTEELDADPASNLKRKSGFTWSF